MNNFRRQLVDFSDSSKFNDSISGLMVGLKKIVSLYVTLFFSFLSLIPRHPLRPPFSSRTLTVTLADFVSIYTVLPILRGEIEEEAEEVAGDATLELVDQAGKTSSLNFSFSSPSFVLYDYFTYFLSPLRSRP